MLANRLFGAVLLVAGTSIGAGMLGLPVMMAKLGFVYSVAVIFAIWALMCFSGLLVLEVNLWFKDDISYISMATRLLGSWGKWLTGGAFLLLLYALMVAYLMSGSSFVLHLIGLVPLHWTTSIGMLPWILVFGALIYRGTHSVDRVNKLLVFGLIIAFAVMAIVMVPHLEPHSMVSSHSEYWLAVLPVVITSFGYHIIIPTLSTYLNRNLNQLRIAIILGSFIPLLVYCLWNWLIFAVIPLTGDDGLLSILASGDVAARLLDAIVHYSGNELIVLAVRAFVFFAISSSFIAVALGLFDFLADGLKIAKKSRARFLLLVLTFLPPMLFTLGYPQGFLFALGYAGVFVAMLHGILPAVMVWVGRRSSMYGNYRVRGGFVALGIVIILSIIVIYAQLALNNGWIALT